MPTDGSLKRAYDGTVQHIGVYSGHIWRLISHRAVVAAAGVMSVVVFGIALSAGLFGVQGEPLDNPLPVIV